jgi:hypothetical protein
MSIVNVPSGPSTAWPVESTADVTPSTKCQFWKAHSPSRMRTVAL